MSLLLSDMNWGLRFLEAARGNIPLAQDHTHQLAVATLAYIHLGGEHPCGGHPDTISASRAVGSLFAVSRSSCNNHVCMPYLHCRMPPVYFRFFADCL